MLVGVTHSAVVMCHIVIRIEICVRNDLSGTGGMDELTIADIDANMGQASLICILEEYDITGLQIGFGDRFAFGVHRSLRTADIDAVAAKYIVDKTGAVKTAGGSAAPLIGDTKILLCGCDNLVAGGCAGRTIGAAVGGATGRGTGGTRQCACANSSTGGLATAE